MSDGTTPKAVTVENFVEAEVDARIFRFIAEGGMNHGLVYEVPEMAPSGTSVGPLDALDPDQHLAAAQQVRSVPCAPGHSELASNRDGRRRCLGVPAAG